MPALLLGTSPDAPETDAPAPDFGHLTRLEHWMVPQLKERYRAAMWRCPRLSAPKTISSLRTERALLDLAECMDRFRIEGVDFSALYDMY